MTGEADIVTSDQKRGCSVRFQGVIALADSSITRFDLLAWGEAWGEGTYTKGAPKGRFPLLISFARAGSKPVDRVPPQGARDWTDYLGG